jgi:hypothetical protein
MIMTQFRLHCKLPREMTLQYRFIIMQMIHMLPGGSGQQSTVAALDLDQTMMIC